MPYRKGDKCLLDSLKCNIFQDEKALKKKVFKFKLGKTFLVCEISWWKWIVQSRWKIYVIKGKDEQLCNCPKRDLELYHFAPWRVMTKGHNQKYQGMITYVT